MLEGLRILVVEDNPINLRMIERLLEQRGASVRTATNGAMALERLADPDGDVDVILMDVQMPVMDGLTATRHIRADPRWSTLPVIALTAGVLPEERQAALDAGMRDFLTKPLDLGELTRLLAGIGKKGMKPGG